MDRISSLPDEIICHIVSSLSAKEAAFVTVLSKRWHNLFTIIPILQFKDWSKIQGSLMDFLDGVLALPASSRIRKFSLRCSKLDPAHYAHVNRCLCDVMKRGVMNLEVNIISVKEGYSLPFEVFSCKTVVELKLGCFVIDVLPENAFLPALKSLYLFHLQFYDLCGCLFHTLLSACPLLEELTIHGDWEHWKWSHTISSPTVQRLTIKRSEYDGFDGSDFGSITFDTPSLVFLEYSDFVPEEYPTVNLDSLVEAKLNLTLTVDHSWFQGCLGFLGEDSHITSDPTNLIQGLRNVETLNLLSTETVETFYLFREAIPLFKNMYHLSFSIDDEVHCWRILPVLLKKTPNLKTLIIEGPLHIAEFEEEPNYVCECLSGYSFLLSCPMEVLEISYYKGTTGELDQVKHFLGKLSCLELLKVRVRERRGDKENLKLTTDLLMLPRASSKCKIQVEFL